MERKIYNSQSICFSTTVPVLAAREVAYKIIYFLVWELSLKAEWDKKYPTSGHVKDSVVAYTFYPALGILSACVELELVFG